MLSFLQAEHLRADDGLVTVLRDKNGNIRDKKVYKKTVDEHYPKDKDFLSDFSIQHPDILDRYRDSLKEVASKIPNLNRDKAEEIALARVLIDELEGIPKGSESANDYHDFCLAALSFIFFPNMINPVKEYEINEGRKRIDITYTNGKESGVFYRLALDPGVIANVVHVECKNYSKDVANPELDQLLGRFHSQTRGKFGMLLFRDCDDDERLVARCRDAAQAGLGVPIPIDDQFIIKLLEHIENDNRRQIDDEIDHLWRALMR